MRDYREDTGLKGIGVVACDMDNTLLADDGSMPEGMEGRIRALDEAGIVFAAASGRPLYTLRDMFCGLEDRMAFISDNGAAVVLRGEVVYRSLLEPAVVRELAEFTLGLGAGAPVACGLDACYVRECDRGFDAVFRRFFHSVAYVDTLDDLYERHGVDVNKFTVYLPGADAVSVRDEAFAPAFGERLSVTCGGAVWIDVMRAGVDKGTGLARLCERVGVSPADAAAFGDTDNDVEMLELAGHSYLMANAEPRMEPHARFRAPSNNERGVAVVVDRILSARGERAAGRAS